MAKKINTEETPQTDNNNIPAPEAQAVPVPETASENLGTGGETEDRLPAKTAGKGNAGSEETTEPHILSLLKKFPAYPSLYIDTHGGTYAPDTAAAIRKSDVASAWDNKGDIIIGNDVWIGYDAVIMAGVTIGDGAIIGTRAVVTKDVEPYSVVGGIPAKEIRKRFSPDIITRLQKLQWWKWDTDKIHKSINAIQAGDINSLDCHSI